MLSRDRMGALGARFTAAVGSGSLARRARPERQERAPAERSCEGTMRDLLTPQAAAEPCLSVADPTRVVPAFLFFERGVRLHDVRLGHMQSEQLGTCMHTICSMAK